MDDVPGVPPFMQTPSYHPLIDGIFHEIDHPAMEVHLSMETLICWPGFKMI